MKIRLLTLWAFALFMATRTRCEDIQCRLAVVEWKDATLYTKTRGAHDLNHPQDLLGVVISFGCLSVSDGIVVLIQSITDGKADDVLLIPAAWVANIKPLQEVKNAEQGPMAPSLNPMGNTAASANSACRVRVPDFTRSGKLARPPPVSPRPHVPARPVGNALDRRKE